VQASELAPHSALVLGGDAAPMADVLATAAANLAAGSQGWRPEHGRREEGQINSQGHAVGDGAASGSRAAAAAHDLLAADATRSPIRTGVVDVVLCDLPFGKRCLAREALPSLYGHTLVRTRPPIHARMQQQQQQHPSHASSRPSSRANIRAPVPAQPNQPYVLGAAPGG
jgi:hypothetical protein